MKQKCFVCHCASYISWVENCQIFFILDINTLPHLSLYVVYTTTTTTKNNEEKRKWIAFYVIILSVYERKHSSLCVHYNIYHYIRLDVQAIRHSPGRWTMFCLLANKTMRSSRNTNVSYLKTIFRAS